MQGARVQSLIRELSSRMPHGKAKKFKIKKEIVLRLEQVISGKVKLWLITLKKNKRRRLFGHHMTHVTLSKESFLKLSVNEI